MTTRAKHFWNEDYYTAFFLGLVTGDGGYPFDFVDVEKSTKIIDPNTKLTVAFDTRAKEKHEQHMLFVLEAINGRLKLDYKQVHQIHPKTNNWRHSSFYSTGISLSARIIGNEKNHDINIYRAISLWNGTIKELGLKEAPIDIKEFDMSRKINIAAVKEVKPVKSEEKIKPPSQSFDTPKIIEIENEKRIENVVSAIEMFFNNLNFCHQCGADLRPMHQLKIEFNCCIGCGFNFQELYKKFESEN